MTIIGLFMLGAACALVVFLAIDPRCALCFRRTTRRRQSYGEGMMSGRFCGQCHLRVLAADANGAVEVIEREASKAINTMIAKVA